MAMQCQKGVITQEFFPNDLDVQWLTEHLREFRQKYTGNYIQYIGLAP